MNIDELGARSRAVVTVHIAVFVRQVNGLGG